MKKLLFALLISATLLSCKKDENCYHCEFGDFNGYPVPDQDYCGEPGRTFQDAQGNEMGSGSCTLK